MNLIKVIIGFVAPIAGLRVITDINLPSNDPGSAEPEPFFSGTEFGKLQKCPHGFVGENCEVDVIKSMEYLPDASYINSWHTNAKHKERIQTLQYELCTSVKLNGKGKCSQMQERMTIGKMLIDNANVESFMQAASMGCFRMPETYGLDSSALEPECQMPANLLKVHNTTTPWIKSMGSSPWTHAFWKSLMISWFAGHQSVPTEQSFFKQPLSNTLKEKPSIAMHVRRGDACNRFVDEPDDWNNDWGKSGRPCFTSEVYLRAARKMKEKYGVSKIALMTDSDEVWKEMKQNKEFDWEFVDYNRKKLFGAEDAGANCTTLNCAKDAFMENNKRDKRLQVESMLNDLHNLKNAKFFVGTSMSATTHLALLSVWGKQGVFPPYIYVDRPMCKGVNFVSSTRRRKKGGGPCIEMKNIF